MNNMPMALSLFDRLIDDAPGTMAEPPLEQEASRRLIRLGLRRDLEGLLNARRPHGGWPSDHADLRATVLGFGLPDLSTDDVSSAAVRERIGRMIAKAIRTHEPRLRRVVVETQGEPTLAGVRFRISATMIENSLEEAVIYDARFRPYDRDFAVTLADEYPS